MEYDELTSLISQYKKLWSDLGVAEIEGKLQGPKVAQLFRRNLSRSKPYQVQAKAPVAGVTSLQSLEDIQAWIGDCRRCQLCEGRNKIVYGSGNAKTRLLFVGEAPGTEEDTQGLPFVGRAGELLTRIIEAMGYARETFFITNVVKCRPPENRPPEPFEIQSCLPFLRAQIEVIQPEMIVALGAAASATLTGSSVSISNLRGKFHPLAWNTKIPVMPTYHPAYLLKNVGAKKLVWEDIKLVKTRLEAQG